MTQGTVSVLIGCHSPMHSLLVGLAWKRLYGRWPRLWEWLCIGLHDVGHWRRNYLDDYEEKKRHWELGAWLAGKLFGEAGYLLVAGHSEHSGAPESPMFRADKLSWHLAPTWWHWMNTITEPRLMQGFTSRRAKVRHFQAQVAASMARGEWRETHRLYLEGERTMEDDPWICPVCGGAATVSCRCPKLDCRCENGHEWHTCLEHKRQVIGRLDHSNPTSDCSCLETHVGERL